MQDFQLRVVAERDELKEKTEKLSSFLDGEFIKTINPDEQKRLRDQFVHMKEYLSILNSRIEAFQ